MVAAASGRASARTVKTTAPIAGAVSFMTQQRTGSKDAGRRDSAGANSVRTLMIGRISPMTLHYQFLRGAPCIRRVRTLGVVAIAVLGGTIAIGGQRSGGPPPPATPQAPPAVGTSAISGVVID